MIIPLADFRQEETERYVIANTLTVKVNDVVALVGSSNQTVATNATGSVSGDKYVYGVVVGFSYNNGNVYPFSGQDPLNTPNQVTTTGTNETVELINAVVLPITQVMKFEMDLSGAATTTAYSNQPGVWFTLTDCRTVNETTALKSDDGSAPLQIMSFGLKDQSTTKIIGRFAKAQLSRP